MIAYSLRPGRTRVDVENGFANGTGSPAAQAGNDLVQWQVIIQNGIHSYFLGLKHFVQRFCLGNGAGKSVQQETASAAKASSPLGYQSQDDFIGNQVSAGHAIQRSRHGRGAFTGVGSLDGAEYVACGQMAGANLGREQFGLGALADTGGPEKHQTAGIGLLHGRNVAPGLAAL
jgi:hypothetical protein